MSATITFNINKYSLICRGRLNMRLQRIYSSKLYVTSTRKDRIHAAMQDPINAELVQQLSEYLDDDAQVELKQAVKEEQAKEAAEQGDDSQVVAPSESSGMSGGGGGGHSSFSGDVFSDFGDDELADIDIPEDSGESEPAEAPVEESTKINGKAIKATSLIWTTIEDVAKECDVIQGTLNAREDTKGVSRMQVKDSELWIYYNDDVNLNDTMIAVIEVLNSTGYTYLAFSRLARSNNAIVFDINLSTSEDIKSVKDIEEENK
jgi:hypothetical protein